MEAPLLLEVLELELELELEELELELDELELAGVGFGVGRSDPLLLLQAARPITSALASAREARITGGLA